MPVPGLTPSISIVGLWPTGIRVLSVSLGKDGTTYATFGTFSLHSGITPKNTSALAWVVP